MPVLYTIHIIFIRMSVTFIGMAKSYDHSSVSAEVSNTPKDIYSLLKDMTSDEKHQTINITCKVYNATNNQLINGETPGNQTRDIVRIQKFSASSVPRGTKVRLEVTTDTPCYLYILNLGTSTNTMLFPSECEEDNFFRPNQVYHFPEHNESEFEITGPPGKEVVQVMAFAKKPDCLTASAPLLRDICVLNNKSQSERRGFAQVEFTVS